MSGNALTVKQCPIVPIDHEAVRRYVAERARNLPPLGHYRAEAKHVDTKGTTHVLGD